MNKEHPERVEAIRLIEKFFPEAKGFISFLNIYSLIEAMSVSIADYHRDFSCEDATIFTVVYSGLQSKGGLAGLVTEVFERLLEHIGLQPLGRVVVVPDAGSISNKLLPFVCDFDRLPERLEALPEWSFDDGSCDKIFVFESGECVCIDHHGRIHWAKSNIRRWSK